ncbi:hypothetical protein [Kribbella sp. CWNU-51]
MYRLPPRNLEAVLARELAHRLAMPRTPSLLLSWLAVPARMMGRAIDFCLKHRVLSILAKIVIGFLLIGVLGVWMFLGFSHYVVFMLSPSSRRSWCRGPPALRNDSPIVPPPNSGTACCSRRCSRVGSSTELSSGRLPFART